MLIVFQPAPFFSSLILLSFYVLNWDRQSAADQNVRAVRNNPDTIIQFLDDLLGKLFLFHFTHWNGWCRLIRSLVDVKICCRECIHVAALNICISCLCDKLKWNLNLEFCVFTGFSQLKSSFGSATSPCLPGKCECALNRIIDGKPFQSFVDWIPCEHTHVSSSLPLRISNEKFARTQTLIRIRNSNHQQSNWNRNSFQPTHHLKWVNRVAFAIHWPHSVR